MGYYVAIYTINQIPFATVLHCYGALHSTSKCTQDLLIGIVEKILFIHNLAAPSDYYRGRGCEEDGYCLYSGEQSAYIQLDLWKAASKIMPFSDRKEWNYGKALKLTWGTRKIRTCEPDELKVGCRLSPHPAESNSDVSCQVLLNIHSGCCRDCRCF